MRSLQLLSILSHRNRITTSASNLPNTHIYSIKTDPVRPETVVDTPASSPAPIHTESHIDDSITLGDLAAMECLEDGAVPSSKRRKLNPAPDASFSTESIKIEPQDYIHRDNDEYDTLSATATWSELTTSSSFSGSLYSHQEQHDVNEYQAVASVSLPVLSRSAVLIRISALRRRLRRRLEIFFKRSCAAKNSMAVLAEDAIYHPDIISDPGRASPHPVDVLYTYLVHNRIRLFHPPAAFVGHVTESVPANPATDAARSAPESRKWTEAEQGALYAYVFEEQPVTDGDWDRIGVRLRRSGAAAKSRFMLMHRSVEQQIIQHYARQKADQLVE
jgi:hypothetical protein